LRVMGNLRWILPVAVALGIAMLVGTGAPSAWRGRATESKARDYLRDPSFQAKARERLFAEAERHPAGQPRGGSPQVAPAREREVPKASLDGSGANAKRSRDEMDRREARRRSPAAKAERQRSRTAHRRKGRAEALQLARQEFPEQTERPAFKPLTLRPSDRLLAYQSPFSALVETERPDGKKVTSIAESTFPLRSIVGSGEAAPVSLVAEDKGTAYQPKNRLVLRRSDAVAQHGFLRECRRCGQGPRSACDAGSRRSRGVVAAAVRGQPRGAPPAF
jgi:hypothetical protein